MSKKVLFIQDNLFLTPDANVRIVFRLIDYLITHHNAEVSLVGRASLDEEYVDEYKGCKLIHEPHLKVQKAYELKNRLGKYLHLLRYILIPRTISYRIHNNEEPYVVELRKWLCKNAHKYDIIIATCSPYYPLKIASEISEKVPVVYYKIDPVATAPVPRNLNKDAQLVSIENEIIWDSCTSRIITTDVIFKYYNQLPTKVNADKVVLLNYPNIVERNLSNDDNNIVVTFDKTKVNICFIGTFYSDIRNPQYLLSLMEQLRDTSIVLHIIGSMGDCVEMIKASMTNGATNIVYHGIVPPSVADDIMLQADVLLHVGNAVDSLMPSKILDYISSGKPILNICKIPTCPTLPLMERYPLGMTVNESDEITDELLDSITRFCTTNKDRSIPFDQIHQLYYDSTIDYVGDKFCDVINEACNQEIKK